MDNQRIAHHPSVRRLPDGGFKAVIIAEAQVPSSIRACRSLGAVWESIETFPEEPAELSPNFAAKVKARRAARHELNRWSGVALS